VPALVMSASCATSASTARGDSVESACSLTATRRAAGAPTA
jgi:hypothetical protein